MDLSGIGGVLKVVEILSWLLQEVYLRARKYHYKKESHHEKSTTSWGKRKPEHNNAWRYYWSKFYYRSL